MEKTRDLFNKIRDIKGTFHAKMGTIKDIDGMELKEAEDIKEVGRRHRNIQKCLNDPGNHTGVVTRLEPDILKCEFKWSLGSICINKASGGDGIPA